MEFRNFAYARELPESRLDDGDRVAGYLHSGHVVLAMAGTLPDAILGDGSRIPWSYAWMTDGEWLWTSEFAYYVKKYGLAPPEDFLVKIREAGYVCPEVEESVVLAATETFRSPSAGRRDPNSPFE